MSKAASSLAFADLVDHALSLIAAADVEPPEKAARTRGELERWRCQSRGHKTVHEEVLRRWRALENVLPGVRACFDEPRVKRRKVCGRGMLCIAALIAAVALATQWWLWQPLFEQTYQTETAQIAKFTLPDGSRIDLNAQSLLQVALYRSRRVMELTRGEARFDVTPSAGKPFQVYTRAGTVDVIGTIFMVSDRGNRVVVKSNGAAYASIRSAKALPWSLAAASVW